MVAFLWRVWYVHTPASTGAAYAGLTEVCLSVRLSSPSCGMGQMVLQDDRVQADILLGGWWGS